MSSSSTSRRKYSVCPPLCEGSLYSFAEVGGGSLTKASCAVSSRSSATESGRSLTSAATEPAPKPPATTSELDASPVDSCWLPSGAEQYVVSATSIAGDKSGAATSS